MTVTNRFNVPIFVSLSKNNVTVNTERNLLNTTRMLPPTLTKQYEALKTNRNNNLPMTGGHWLHIGPLSESEFETVLQKKIGDGFVGNRNFTEWFRDQALQWKRVPSDAENRARETGASMLHLW